MEKPEPTAYQMALSANEAIKELKRQHRQATKELLERLQEVTIDLTRVDHHLVSEELWRISKFIKAELAKLEEPNETQRPKEA